MLAAREFAEDVTVTQLSHAAKSRDWPNTVFWMTLLIISVAFSIYQTVLLFGMLFTYPKTTEVKIMHGAGMSFPAVTICNSNPWRRSKLFEFAKIQSSWEFVSTVAGLKSKQRSDDKLGNAFNKPAGRKKRGPTICVNAQACKCPTETVQPNRKKRTSSDPCDCTNICAGTTILNESGLIDNFQSDFYSSPTKLPTTTTTKPTTTTTTTKRTTTTTHLTTTTTKPKTTTSTKLTTRKTTLPSTPKLNQKTTQSNLCKLTIFGYFCASATSIPPNLFNSNMSLPNNIPMLANTSFLNAASNSTELPWYVLKVQEMIANGNFTIENYLETFFPQFGTNLPPEILKLITEIPVQSIVEDFKNDTQNIIDARNMLKETFGLENYTLRADNNTASLLLKTVAPFLVAVEKAITLRDAGYNYTSLFTFCKFENSPCNVDDDIVQTTDLTMGNCFTFNHWNAINNNHFVARSGSQGGLTFYMKVSQEEFMPESDTAGVKVLVHDQNSTIFSSTEGIVVPIGYTVDFSVQMAEVNRVQPPYGDCRDNKITTDYFYDGHYSFEGCMRSCFQKQIVGICGCADPKTGISEELLSLTRYCIVNNEISTQDYNCVTKTKEEFATNTTMKEKCRCSSACQERTYYMSPSFAKRPKSKNTYSEPNLIIKVYLKTLTYVVYEESSDYTIASFLSDLGGVLGNNLGFSFITCFEMALIGFLICGQRNVA